MRLRLADGERVIVKTRTHRRVLLRPAVALLLVSAAAGYVTGLLGRSDLPAPLERALPFLNVVVPVTAAVLVLAWCVIPLVRWSTTWTYLTNRRLVVRRGMAGKEQWELPLALVRGIDVKQSMAQRGSGAGSLVLHAGGRPSVLVNMPAVHRLAELVTDAIAGPRWPAPLHGVEIDGNPNTDWMGNG
jgi:membrane protein YdbS with pleckstrin-like domain